MALPDTTSKPSFISTTPDYSKPMMLRTQWETSGFENREGGPQFFRQMAAPKIAFTFQRNGYDAPQFALERRKRADELSGAVVVPVWVQWMTLATNGGNSVTVSATIESLKFKAGSWAFFKQGANECFRKIVSASGTTITLSATGADFEPVGFNFALFTAGARVYPCILGMWDKNAVRFSSRRADRSSLVFTIAEL